MSTVLTFADEFNGTSGAQPNVMSWTQGVTNGHLLNGSGRVEQKVSGSTIRTQGKVVFNVDGTGIRIESRFGASTTAYDTHMAIIDADGDVIQVGVTTYSSVNNYSIGTGKYSLSQVGTGTRTNSARWYRLQVVTNQLQYHYSTDRVTWTHVHTRTLAASITGRTFYLRIGGGFNPYVGAFHESVYVYSVSAGTLEQGVVAIL